MKQPMLAATLDDPKSIRFPVLVSPKLDGIRCVIVDGKPLTRKMKPIPNRYISKMLSGLPALDGELLALHGGFNETQSIVMSEEHPLEKEVYFYVFDRIDFAAGFARRLESARQFVDYPPRQFNKPFLRWVPHQLCADLRSFVIMEQQYVLGGAEGIMLRDPEGPYKQGRSTLREGWLIKYKRFAIDEAIVVGFEERQINGNTKKRDERGYSKRSTAKAGLCGAGTLGKLIVRHVNDPDCRFGRFGIGSGFTAEVAQEIWDNQKKYLGKLARYKHQPSGALEAPRFPVFAGWRDERDMS